MVKLKFDKKVYDINIKVKKFKITVKETSTPFQRFVLFVMQTDKLTQEKKTEILTKVNAFISEAYAQYDKIDSEASAQYDKIDSEASAQYDKIDSEASAQYDKIDSEAYAQYDKIRSEASAQYDKIRSEAYAQRQEKINVKIKELIKEYKIDYKY